MTNYRDLGCYCPSDCRCHAPWRGLSACGCLAHETEPARAGEPAYLATLLRTMDGAQAGSAWLLLAGASSTAAIFETIAAEAAALGLRRDAAFRNVYHDDRTRARYVGYWCTPSQVREKIATHERGYGASGFVGPDAPRCADELRCSLAAVLAG